MVVHLEQGTEALEKALALSKDRFFPAERESVHNVLEHIHERQRFGFETTVVAFAGGTGAGKSSLVNALLGGAYTVAAPIRPTTREALAVSSAPTPELLDYIGVRERTVDNSLEEIFPALKNRGRHSRPRTLVVLDLPDIDSDERRNREIAARLTAKADVMIWVLDPQKYADAVLHEQYLSQMSDIAGSALVVLNRIDEVALPDRDVLLSDVARVVNISNFSAPFLALSAKTGEGIEDLRQRINAIIKTKDVMSQRCAGEIRSCAHTMCDAVTRDGGAAEPAEKESHAGICFDHVSSSLAHGLGADVVADAAADSYRLRGRKATSWPLLRIMRSSKVDPLQRLHLLRSEHTAAHDNARDKSGNTGTSQLPVQATGLQATHAAILTARNFIGTCIREQTAAMPRQWAVTSRQIIEKHTEEFFAGADELIQLNSSEYARHPFWWRLVNCLQWLAFITALTGGIWLVLWNFADMLKLQIPSVAGIGIIPIPTLLLIAGLAVGWLLSVACIPLISKGSQRTRQRIISMLRKATAKRVQRYITQPAERETARYWEFLEALDKATHTQA